jgi:ParB-like chromosome segregation protein Spo0J
LLAEVQIPPVEIVETLRLTVDQSNPNRMSKAQMLGLKASIKQYGFIIPVVTNKDLMIADGEQRWTVAKELGLQKIPIVRLPLEDVDRRTLRQVLNKLKGEHDQKLDAVEFQRIIQAGGKDDLKTLLAISDSSIQVMLKRLDEEDGQGIGGIEATFEVVVSCKSEEDQKQAFEDLKQRGYTCRLLTL